MSNAYHRTLTYKGISMWLSEWAKELEIRPSTLSQRIKNGLDEDRIFSKGSLRKKKTFIYYKEEYNDSI